MIKQVMKYPDISVSWSTRPVSSHMGLVFVLCTSGQKNPPRSLSNDLSSPNSPLEPSRNLMPSGVLIVETKLDQSPTRSPASDVSIPSALAHASNISHVTGYSFPAVTGREKETLAHEPLPRLPPDWVQNVVTCAFDTQLRSHVRRASIMGRRSIMKQCEKAPWREA